MTSRPSRLSSSLTGCPIHTALSHSEIVCVYIIYIYICVCVSVCDHGFHAICILQWSFQKDWIWLIFNWNVGVICVCVLLIARTYIHFHCLLLGKGEMKEKSENGRVSEEGWKMDCCNQNYFFSLNPTQLYYS